MEPSTLHGPIRPTPSHLSPGPGPLIVQLEARLKCPKKSGGPGRTPRLRLRSQSRAAAGHGGSSAAPGPSKDGAGRPGTGQELWYPAGVSDPESFVGIRAT
eukprot:473301-Hanusia_phi.AAC.1